MRRRISVLLLSMLIALSAAGCAESGAPDAGRDAAVPGNAPSEEVAEEIEEEIEETGEPAKEQEEPLEEEAEAAETEEELEEEEAEEEVEEGKVYYDDEFTRADDYEKYGESGDAGMQDLIWLEGKITDYKLSERYMILSTDEGDWQVSVGSAGTDYYYVMCGELVGKKVRVFGTYTGFSKDLGMPTIAFQPKEYYNYAFRIETVDNSFRLTQLDYRFEDPRLDNDRTYGRLTFKDSSSWDSKMVDDSLMYYTSDDMPAIIMGHVEPVTKAFDEISEEDYLADLASEYVDSADEIITKEPFEFEGYPALCFENTWTDEDLPMPMSLYCYMFIVDDEYYYFGCGEPYLIGESSKRILPAMLKDFSVGDDSAAESAKEDKKDKDKDKDNKDKETKDKETKDNKDTAKSEEKASEEAPAQAPAEPAPEPAPEPAAPAREFPTRDELLGKVFSETGTITVTGKNNEGSFSDTQALPDFLMTADMLVNYNEATGVTSFSMDQNGESYATTMRFTFGADGKISYTGSISVDAPQYTGEGTIYGSER